MATIIGQGSKESTSHGLKVKHGGGSLVRGTLSYGKKVHGRGENHYLRAVGNTQKKIVPQLSNLMEKFWGGIFT